MALLPPGKQQTGKRVRTHPRENAPGADSFHGLKVGSPWDCAFSEIVQDAGPENLLGTCRPRPPVGPPPAPVRSAARPGRRAATMGRKANGRKIHGETQGNAPGLSAEQGPRAQLFRAARR